MLMGCLAYADRLDESPYALLFKADMWEDAKNMLISAYCMKISLPRISPVTLCNEIGESALPKISKVQVIMKERKGVEWTQQNELPVEIELSKSHRFHSVFTCPVLRLQTSKENPPMMMPCGHVICREALTRLSKGSQYT